MDHINSQRHRTRSTRWSALLVASLMLGTATQGFAQGGTTCATAELVTVGNYTYGAMTTTGGTGSCNNSSYARWYRFVAPSEGSVTVKSCHTGNDTRVGLYSTCGGVCLATSDDDNDYSCHSSGYNSSITRAMTAGETIYIEWHGTYASGQNATNWSLSFVAPSTCANPTVISSFPHSSSGSTCGAGNTYGAQCSGSYGGGARTWCTS